MLKRNALNLGLVGGVATAVLFASLTFLVPEKKHVVVATTPGVDTITTVQDLKDIVAHFVQERGWEKTDSPKNLSMSIAIEAAELMEHFQFASGDQSWQKINTAREPIEHELADVVIYALAFANQTGIDLSGAIKRKMEKNSQKYALNTTKGKLRHQVVRA